MSNGANNVTGGELLPTCLHVDDTMRGAWGNHPDPAEKALWWFPSSCDLRYVSPKAVGRCLRNRRIAMFGDCLLLSIFENIARPLLQLEDGRAPTKTKSSRSDVGIHFPGGHIKLSWSGFRGTFEFWWAPSVYHQQPRTLIDDYGDFDDVLLGMAAWNMGSYYQGTDKYFKTLQSNVASLKGLGPRLTLFDLHKVWPVRCAEKTQGCFWSNSAAKEELFREAIHEVASCAKLDGWGDDIRLWSTLGLTRSSVAFSDGSDAVHYGANTSTMQAQVLLNMLCEDAGGEKLQATPGRPLGNCRSYQMDKRLNAATGQLSRPKLMVEQADGISVDGESRELAIEWFELHLNRVEMGDLFDGALSSDEMIVFDADLSLSPRLPRRLSASPVPPSVPRPGVCSVPDWAQRHNLVPWHAISGCEEGESMEEGHYCTVQCAPGHLPHPARVQCAFDVFGADFSPWPTCFDPNHTFCSLDLPDGCEDVDNVPVGQSRTVQCNSYGALADPQPLRCSFEPEWIFPHFHPRVRESVDQSRATFHESLWTSTRTSTPGPLFRARATSGAGRNASDPNGAVVVVGSIVALCIVAGYALSYSRPTRRPETVQHRTPGVIPPPVTLGKPV